MDKVIVVYILASLRGQPSVCLVEALLGFVGVEESSINVEDFLEVVIHFGVAEEPLSIVIIQESKEQNGKWHSDDLLVLELGRSGSHGVDVPHHFIYCVSSKRNVRAVGLGQGIQTSLEAHPDHWVAFDGFFELADFSEERLVVLNAFLGDTFDVVGVFGSGG